MKIKHQNNMTKIISFIVIFFTFNTLTAQVYPNAAPTNLDENKYSNNQIPTSEDMYSSTFHEYLIYDTNENKSLLINRYDGVLECYDSHFERKWTFKPKDTLRLSNSRNQFYYKDGVIFTAYMTGYIYAINANDGSLFWSSKIGLDHEELHLSSQSLEPFKNKLFVSSRKNKNIYAIDASTGDFIWNYSMPSPHVYMPYATYGDLVLINNDPIISTFNADTGKPIHQVNFNSNMGKTVSTEELIIIPIDADKKIVAFSPEDFLPIWEFEYDKEHYGIGKNIFIDDKKVYFATKTNNEFSGVYCLNTTDGKLIWKKEVQESIKYIEDIGSNIYGYTMSNTLFVISKENASIEHFELEHQPVSNFQHQNDHLYFYSKEGLIKYDFKLKTEAVVIPFESAENGSLYTQILFTN